MAKKTTIMFECIWKFMVICFYVSSACSMQKARTNGRYKVLTVCKRKIVIHVAYQHYDIDASFLIRLLFFFLFFFFIHSIFSLSNFVQMNAICFLLINFSIQWIPFTWWMWIRFRNSIETRWTRKKSANLFQGMIFKQVFFFFFFAFSFVCLFVTFSSEIHL